MSEHLVTDEHLRHLLGCFARLVRSEARHQQGRQGRRQRNSGNSLGVAYAVSEILHNVHTDMGDPTAMISEQFGYNPVGDRWIIDRIAEVHPDTPFDYTAMVSHGEPHNFGDLDRRLRWADWANDSALTYPGRCHKV